MICKICPLSPCTVYSLTDPLMHFHDTSVVQQDERDQKIREALHEMAKPLARHADDDDMNQVGVCVAW